MYFKYYVYTVISVADTAQTVNVSKRPRHPLYGCPSIIWSAFEYIQFPSLRALPISEPPSIYDFLQGH